jgi:hypothetical protein
MAAEHRRVYVARGTLGGLDARIRGGRLGGGDEQRKHQRREPVRQHVRGGEKTPLRYDMHARILYYFLFFF